MPWKNCIKKWGEDLVTTLILIVKFSTVLLPKSYVFSGCTAGHCFSPLQEVTTKMNECVGNFDTLMLVG